MTAEPQRRCRYCNHVLPKLLRPQAKYCSNSHRVLAFKQRLMRRERLQTASRSIEGSAPRDAAYYRLRIQIEGRGPLRPFGPFELQPFEPPRVPIVGVYQIEYLDAVLGALKTPTDMLPGIFIKNADPKVWYW